jgi:SAM-dependent methyltransferase
MAPSFQALIEEANNAPIEGWDFGWLHGRATEERPPWGYSRLAAKAAGGVSALLDLQTGGGELLAGLPSLPALTVATESWKPNVGRAATKLRPREAWVLVADDARLPFGEGTFELVISRHPVVTCWEEVARVLAPRGRFLSQQIGPRSMAEVTEFLMGPQARSNVRTPQVAVAAAESAGLRVERVESARLRAIFSDVGAVVYFLRLVVWTVPDFSVEKYRDRLLALHRHIDDEGPFVAHATRFLIEVSKPI